MADLSVVIASCVGPPFISRCLESVQTAIQKSGADVEVMVVDRAGGELPATLKRDFPWVRLIRRDAGESVPDLRRHGIVEAKADYIAIIEEHCVAREDWIAVILRMIREQPAAVYGGPVDDSNFPRLMDWAVYFTEYNSYMPPFQRGATWNVCAANCVYRRDLLVKHLPPAGSGYWEASLNKALLDAGEKFLDEPGMVVKHTGPFGFFYYLGQRYLFSRAFAGVRRQRESLGFRIKYLLLAPLLMPLLIVRIASRVRAKRHRFDKFLRVLPIMIPVSMVYVWGEWVGFLLGPGDALSRIE